MKRCFCMLLAVLLLLPGCGKKKQQPAPPATVPATTGLYYPNHPVEQETVGAVRAYPLGGNQYNRIAVMGNKLLLIGADGTACVLQGENCEVMANGSLPVSDSYAEANAQQIAVYLPETGEVVLLNPQLQEIDRIALPQDMQGSPVISLATNEIYYCRANEIRALNLENQTPRLVKVLIAGDHTLTGCYFEGSVICCESTDESGKTSVSYLSGLTGQTLYEGTEIEAFYTCQDRYYLQRTDHTVVQHITGTREGEAQALAVENGEAFCQALSMNGVVSHCAAENGTELSFHDLSLGQTTGKLTLPGTVAALVADEQFVWLIMQEQDQQVLYRWEVKQNALEEAVPVTGPLYTPQSPDLEGLEACRKLADQYDDSYGVRIRIWEEAAKQTGGYTVVAEHQPAILHQMLTGLEPALQLFPQDFLRKTVRTGWIRICLVRSIASNQNWVQFWADGDCYVLISAQADPAQAFLEAVWYGIDARVIGNSRDYDTWNQLNPEGFTYGLSEYDPAVLEGENRAFVNERCLESPNEDRRQLFIAAMTEGNETLFASELLQNKLRRLCEGIREAYGLEKKKEHYLWEQYLTEPMVEIDG